MFDVLNSEYNIVVTCFNCNQNRQSSLPSYKGIIYRMEELLMDTSGFRFVYECSYDKIKEYDDIFRHTYARQLCKCNKCNKVIGMYNFILRTTDVKSNTIHKDGTRFGYCRSCNRDLNKIEKQIKNNIKEEMCNGN